MLGIIRFSVGLKNARRKFIGIVPRSFLSTLNSISWGLGVGGGGEVDLMAAISFCSTAAGNEN